MDIVLLKALTAVSVLYVLLAVLARLYYSTFVDVNRDMVGLKKNFFYFVTCTD